MISRVKHLGMKSKISKSIFSIVFLMSYCLEAAESLSCASFFLGSTHQQIINNVAELTGAEAAVKKEAADYFASLAYSITRKSDLVKLRVFENSERLRLEPKNQLWKTIHSPEVVGELLNATVELLNKDPQIFKKFASSMQTNLSAELSQIRSKEYIKTYADELIDKVLLFYFEEKLPMPRLVSDFYQKHYTSPIQFRFSARKMTNIRREGKISNRKMGLKAALHRAVLLNINPMQQILKVFYNGKHIGNFHLLLSETAEGKKLIIIERFDVISLKASMGEELFLIRRSLPEAMSFLVQRAADMGRALLMHGHQSTGLMFDFSQYLKIPKQPTPLEVNTYIPRYEMYRSALDSSDIIKKQFLVDYTRAGLFNKASAEGTKLTSVPQLSRLNVPVELKQWVEMFDEVSQNIKQDPLLQVFLLHAMSNKDSDLTDNFSMKYFYHQQAMGFNFFTSPVTIRSMIEALFPYFVDESISIKSNEFYQVRL